MTSLTRTLIATLIVGAAAPAFAAAKDEDAIKARVSDFFAVFSKGDAKAASAFWLEDGTLVNPVGTAGKGPAANFHRFGFAHVDPCRPAMGGRSRRRRNSIRFGTG